MRSGFRGIVLVAPLLLAGLLVAGLPGRVAAIGGNDGPASSAPRDPAYSEAVKLVKAENYAAALALLEKAVQTDPTNADAYNYLGYSHRKLGDVEKAMANYLKALELEPKHLGANEYLGELYLELDQLAKAEERLKVLDKACFFGCEEYSELKEKIVAYKAKTGS